MGYDSPQFENPCNTDRHIKMEISILAGDPVSPTITRNIDETGTKRVHKNTTSVAENTMTTMKNISNVRIA